jgi:hypothetical protein
MLSEKDLLGVIHGLPDSPHLLRTVERLSVSLSGGASYTPAAPEWMGFEALFWQSMDSLASILDEEQVDIVLERLEAARLPLHRTSFLTELEPAEMTKTITPFILEKSGVQPYSL